MFAQCLEKLKVWHVKASNGKKLRSSYGENIKFFNLEAYHNKSLLYVCIYTFFNVDFEWNRSIKKQKQFHGTNVKKMLRYE